MVIDVHAHTFPDAMASKVLSTLTAKAWVPVTPAADGTVGSLLESMRRDGVDYAVVCPIATKPSQFDVILREALAIRDGERGETAARHLIPFGSVHPADGARVEHLRRLAECGIRGIKLHPYYQEFVLDAPDMLELFRCCRDLSLVVQCHCGFDVGFPLDPLCGPERVSRVAREVPGLRFIAAHLGGWRQWGGSAENLLGKDVWLDTAVLGPDFGDPLAQRILREHPAERLLFATDWPWLGFADALRYARGSGRPPDQVRAILGANAAGLLGITEASPW
jgi:predicted TIM-barrel fold metal-dependent hydrolase